MALIERKSSTPIVLFKFFNENKAESPQKIAEKAKNKYSFNKMAEHGVNLGNTILPISQKDQKINKIEITSQENDNYFSFISILRRILTGEISRNSNIEDSFKIKRSESPALKAYTPTGHNNLDIKQNSTSYSKMKKR